MRSRALRLPRDYANGRDNPILEGNRGWIKRLLDAGFRRLVSLAVVDQIQHLWVWYVFLKLRNQHTKLLSSPVNSAD